MKLLSVDTVQIAIEKFSQCLNKISPKTEVVTLSNSMGRIMANPLISKVNLPAFTRSSVDGYAVISSDTYGVGEQLPGFLKIIGASEMGKSCDLSLCKGECVYVLTGGMLPSNADAVVMVEYCELFGAYEVAIYQPAKVKDGVVLVGEDCKVGDVLIEKATKINTAHIGIFAAMGVGEVEVFSKIRVSIYASGDEVVGIECEPKLGEVRDINSYLIAYLNRDMFEVIRQEIIGDDRVKLARALRLGLSDSDLIVLSGGSSQGVKDLSASLLDELGLPGVFTHGIAMKPGKPTILGFANEVALVGLPGHPVASFIVFKVIIEECYRRWLGCVEPLSYSGLLQENIAGGNGRQVYQLVSLNWVDDHYVVVPIYGKSGLISTLTRAVGYIVINKDQEGLPANSLVAVTLI